MTRAALLRVSPEVLAEFLQVPEGVEILDVQRDVFSYCGFLFRVKGLGPEVFPGDKLTLMDGVVTRNPDGTKNIVWEKD